ncbi:MAG: hypothetical protein K8L91_21030 [Anaerolineae bacterium]|nr:hypothetical protein [Anaerolineae bacterium]
MGNLATTTTGSDVTTYTYDALDRLITAQVPGSSAAAYTYDPTGQRVRQTVGSDTTNYLWDELSAYGDVVRETNGTGTELASYTLAGSQILGQTRSGVTSYYLSDGQGSTRALLNGTGDLTDTYAYTAFGEIYNQTGGTLNNYLYTGQQFDSLMGLYSLRARYYDPGVGRFVSRDTYPIDYQNPIELNRYGYTANNPINGYDPTGLQAMLESGGRYQETGKEVEAPALRIYSPANNIINFADHVVPAIATTAETAAGATPFQIVVGILAKAGITLAMIIGLGIFAEYLIKIAILPILIVIGLVGPLLVPPLYPPTGPQPQPNPTPQPPFTPPGYPSTGPTTGPAPTPGSDGSTSTPPQSGGPTTGNDPTNDPYNPPQPGEDPEPAPTPDDDEDDNGNGCDPDCVIRAGLAAPKSLRDGYGQHRSLNLWGISVQYKPGVLLTTLASVGFPNPTLSYARDIEIMAAGATLGYLITITPTEVAWNPYHSTLTAYKNGNMYTYLPEDLSVALSIAFLRKMPNPNQQKRS